MPSSPSSALAADVHRHHRAQALARRVFAASEQQCAQPAGGGTQHDIVDLAAKRGTDLLHLLELDVDGRESSCRADRHVQARVRRRDQLVADEQVDHGPRALQCLPRMHQRVRAGASGREARAGRLANGLGWMRKPCVPGRGGRHARAVGRGRLARHRLCVEQQVDDVDRADAVDQAVVGLPHQRPAAVCQTVEQHHLPQRTAAVQAVRVEVRDPVQELALVTRRRERRVTDVRFDLKALIALPGGPGKPSRARHVQLLPVARQHVQAVFEVLAHLSDRRRPAAGERVEHERPADVHQRAVIGLLELQERRVERR